MERELPGASLPEDLGSAHVTLRQGKAATRATGRQPIPHTAVGVIQRVNRHTIGRQGLQHGAVFLGHGLHGLHELLVLALRVVDQRHRGPSQTGQPGDLAGVVHAQLHHADAMLRAQGQQCQRHADVVVEVAPGGMGRIGGMRTQDAGDHLRHRCLAVAAGHRDQRQAQLRTPAGGEFAQGDAAVGHDQGRQTRSACRGLPRRLADHGGCTLRSRLVNELVGVKPLATQGHEQVACLQAARIGVHTRHTHGFGALGAHA